MPNFASMLNLEGQMIYFIGIGISSREKLITRTSTSKQTVSKHVNSLIGRKLVIVTTEYKCPHCGKVIEGLSDLERLELSPTGKEYFDVIKPFMDAANTKKEGPR